MLNKKFDGTDISYWCIDRFEFYPRWYQSLFFKMFIDNKNTFLRWPRQSGKTSTLLHLSVFILDNGLKIVNKNDILSKIKRFLGFKEEITYGNNDIIIRYLSHKYDASKYSFDNMCDILKSSDYYKSKIDNGDIVINDQSLIISFGDKHIIFGIAKDEEIKDFDYTFYDDIFNDRFYHHYFDYIKKSEINIFTGIGHYYNNIIKYVNDFKEFHVTLEMTDQYGKDRSKILKEQLSDKFYSMECLCK